MKSAPVATYRIQLGSGFGFAAAARIVPHLRELGISHVYCSPYLQAAGGSTHGYDVVDPTRVSAELGGDEGHAELVSALAGAGMAHILDIVPNHMATTDRRNRWWWDVLADGRSSPHAASFDIDWEPQEPKLRHRLLLPILGDHVGAVLDAGGLPVEVMDGELIVRHFDHLVPLSPETTASVLRAAHAMHPAPGLRRLAQHLDDLPRSLPGDANVAWQRQRERHAVAAALDGLMAEADGNRHALLTRLREINGDPDQRDRLLRDQHHRLAFWRTAAQEVNYRRFFDISSLIALRMEDEATFAAWHSRLREWIADGSLAGVRVDHVDGLREPAAYLRRLRSVVGDSWLVVEKILERDETLPPDWPVEGTTGYEAGALITRLLIDPAGEAPLTELWSMMSGSRNFAEEARLARLQVMDTVLASDVERVVGRWSDVCADDRHLRDYTRMELRSAIVHTVAAMPVYRTYARPGDAGPHADDIRAITAAVTEASSSGVDPRLVDHLGQLVLAPSHSLTDAAIDVVLRFQQLCASVMAKGVEDTAFYRFSRLAALNEVGGSPGMFSSSIDEFHQRCMEAAELWPYRLVSTSTHDTKRSEDVRARLCCLSGHVDVWATAVRRWLTMTAPHRSGDTPDLPLIALFFQTLVGAYPLSRERAHAYMEKASREAKLRTSWIEPNAHYDRALRTFIDACYDDEDFLGDVARITGPLIHEGRLVSLSQTLLKLTMPGVPDIYQGCEVWDLSLVDPDNRRPIDHRGIATLLTTVESMDAAGLWAEADTGAPKLRMIVAALRLRRQNQAAFGAGSLYRPLWATGPHADRVVAYVRGRREPEVAVVAPRHRWAVGAEWRDTTLELPGGRPWRDVVTGVRHEAGSVAVAEVVEPFGVALLARDS